MNLEQNVQYINIEDIIPNRFQPRLTFDENGLKELAMSIKEHGIIQPLVLRKLNSNKFEIIAGERRYKASQIAGLNKVPAIIADLDDNKSAEVALVENLQRRNLSAIEEAKSYKKLLDRGYLTQDQLAKRLGISQSSVANKIRLLNLGEEAQDALMNEKISERHARSLLQITDLKEQTDLLNKIINKRMTVRQLDEEIKRIQSTTKTIEPNETTSLMDQIETLDFNISNDKQPIEDNLSTESNNLIKAILDSKKDIFDIPTAEESITQVEKEEIASEKKQPIIISGDLNSVIKNYKELEVLIKNAGFKIETEDYDFEDLYQIIIKIEK